MSRKLVEEMRKLKKEKLFDELDASINDLLELRTKVSTGQLADVSQVRKARRKIALLRTLINESEE